MAQGKAITDQQIELIKATFAETGSITAAAKAAGCSLSTAKKYADTSDRFEELRSEKRVDIIAKIAQAQIILIEAMTDPVKLAKSSLHDIGVAFGIVTDKGLLLSGQATQRTESVTVDPAARLTPDEMETMARVREKLAAEVGA